MQRLWNKSYQNIYSYMEILIIEFHQVDTFLNYLRHVPNKTIDALRILVPSNLNECVYVFSVANPLSSQKVLSNMTHTRERIADLSDQERTVTWESRGNQKYWINDTVKPGIIISKQGELSLSVDGGRSFFSRRTDVSEAGRNLLDWGNFL